MTVNAKERFCTIPHVKQDFFSTRVLLTFLCLICRYVLCLGLMGRQGLDHKAKNIWTKELRKRGKQGLQTLHLTF